MCFRRLFLNLDLRIRGESSYDPYSRSILAFFSRQLAEDFYSVVCSPVGEVPPYSSSSFFRDLFKLALFTTVFLAAFKPASLPPPPPKTRRSCC